MKRRENRGVAAGWRDKNLLTSFGHKWGMSNKPPCQKRVTFAIQLADGTILPVEMNPDSVQFVGGFSRLAAFGPLGARISARIVARG